ncbi:glycine/betaine ABC transporter [Novibacillus thermophilus]|uniref:Glycine/betaine ABC transporter n=2 Tax=Novibacillus thermophilus TaxID=1471761 RepID=A0A1U9KC06_9BACL|nr:glycine/betaine ABC transporter [Novibacillus thermophilus]
MGMVLAACGGATDNSGENSTEETNNNNDQDAEDGNGTITLVYDNWADQIASSHVLKKAMEDRGFTVELTTATISASWAGVADGSADVLLAAWLPITHNEYYERFKDQLVDLGPNTEGAKIGLVVPEYVTIDSIEELNHNADKFNNQIVGVEPGAGIMQRSEKATDEYGLELELMTSSEAGMMSELQRNYDSEEWIVVTGWTPHWKFAKFDLKFLEDPQGVFGETEEIHTIVRQGLEDDNPGAYKVLDNFHWTLDDMNEVMVDMEDGMEPEEAAAKWVENNQDQVEEWFVE